MPPLSARTIVMVEDNEDDYEAMERCFRLAHIRNPVKWCKSGREALDYLRCEGFFKGEPFPAPAVVLMDLNMPGMDGRKALEHIKADPNLRRIPVVILTTSADEGDIERCYELGAASFIQKPIDFEGLQRTVARIRDYWLETALLPNYGR
jgi:two-component system response regulator